MYGFATFESKELMPLPIVLARKLAIKMDELTSKIPELFDSDGKCQVSIAYDENDNPVKVILLLSLKTIICMMDVFALTSQLLIVK